MGPFSPCGSGERSHGLDGPLRGGAQTPSHTHRDTFLSCCSRGTLRSWAPRGANGSPGSRCTAFPRGALREEMQSDPKEETTAYTPEDTAPHPPTTTVPRRRAPNWMHYVWPCHPSCARPGHRPPRCRCRSSLFLAHPFLVLPLPPGTPDSPQDQGGRPDLHFPSNQLRPMNQRFRQQMRDRKWDITGPDPGDMQG